MEEKEESVLEEKDIQKENTEIENSDLENTKKELEETNDRLKRLMAEFDNFKKRSAKERENLYNSILSDIVSSILPTIDNLDKAVLVETKDEQYKQGVELVAKQLKDVLTSFGVEKIETIRKNF